MTSFEVEDDALKTLKDKVIIVTGGSSGIGLAAVKVLLSRGAKVVVGDVHTEPLSPSDAFYQQVDVRDWSSQLHMFKQTIAKFGRIDHVFANAGTHASSEHCLRPGRRTKRPITRHRRRGYVL